MINPTRDQVQVVLNNFAKVLERARKLEVTSRSVRMHDGKVHYDCGTPMCHGGWYCVATIQEGTHYRNYQDGSFGMARDLGFRDTEELKQWAQKNPLIWGNIYGDYMFSDALAFLGDSEEPETALTLDRIFDHWRGVYKRLPA